MNFFYINYNNDKDFKFRYIDKNLNRFLNVLSSDIQVDINTKYISHRNNSYKVKNRI